jgi:hypothetical protein
VDFREDPEDHLAGRAFQASLGYLGCLGCQVSLIDLLAVKGAPVDLLGKILKEVLQLALLPRLFPNKDRM